MWKRIKPEDTERENRVLIPLVQTRIGRRLYSVGRCRVAGRSSLAVKAGREKYIGNRGMVLDWLTARGLSLSQARTFLREGLVTWDLNSEMRELLTARAREIAR